MAPRAHFDAARTRYIVPIQLALQHQNFQKARKTLHDGMREFPDNVELQRVQFELFHAEHASNVTNTLLKHGRRKIENGDFEAGIDKLRQANQLNPSNHETQEALFDALVHFAKVVADSDSKSAEQLLRDAARISPLNLQIEKVGEYLAERVRQRRVEQCLSQVERLRRFERFREALKQVAELEEQLHAYPIPALEQMRQELLWEIATKCPAEIQPVVDPPADAEHEAPHEVPHVVPQEVKAAESNASPASAPHQRIHARIQNAWNEARRTAGTFAQALRIRMSTRRHEKVMHAVTQGMPAALAVSANRARTAWGKIWSGSVGMLKANPLIAGVACLVLVFAAVTIGRSTDTAPALNPIGTGTLMLPVTLFRNPAADSGIAGSLKSGEAVELLQQIPEESLDAWVRLRAAGNRNMDGYVRLRNLDGVQTADPHFNIWYALTLLDRSASRPEFRKRLEAVETLLKDSSPAVLRDFDAANLAVAKSFARLAAENTDDPEIASRDIKTAEFHMSRIQGGLRNSSEADIVQWSIEFTRASLPGQQDTGGPEADEKEAIVTPLSQASVRIHP